MDFVIAETNDFVGEALIGLEVCQELGLPAHGHLRQRAAREDLRRLRLRRGLQDAGRRRRGGRRAELLARARRRCCRCWSGSARRSTSRSPPSRCPTGPRPRRRLSSRSRPTDGRAPVPDPARAVPVHALRDGRLRPPRARDRRRVHRHLLRRRAAPRPRDGRGAGPRRRRPAATRPRSSSTRSSARAAGTSRWAAGTRSDARYGGWSMSHVDLHLHLLPGVDDGPDDEAASLAHAARLARDGVYEATVTPHIGHPWFPLEIATIPERTQRAPGRARRRRHRPEAAPRRRDLPPAATVARRGRAGRHRPRPGRRALGPARGARSPASTRPTSPPAPTSASRASGC